MAGVDDDLPPLEDAAVTTSAVHHHQSQGSWPGSAIGVAAASAIMSKEQSAARSSAPKNEFRTVREMRADEPEGEDQTLQEQLMAAALKKTPEQAKVEKAKDVAVTKDFVKGSSIKKGFLLGGSAPKKSAPAPTAGAGPAAAKTATSSASGSASIPLLTASKGSAAAGGPGGAKADPLRLPEVQEAMARSMGSMERALADKGSWLTPALIARMLAEPSLAAGMGNPRFMGALAEMQRDPKGAIAKYKDDAALTAFLRTFMGLLGEHFTQLGKGAGADAAAAGSGGKAAAAGSGAAAAAAASAPAKAAPAAAAALPAAASASSSAAGSGLGVGASSGAGGITLPGHLSRSREAGERIGLVEAATARGGEPAAASAAAALSLSPPQPAAAASRLIVPLEDGSSSSGAAPRAPAAAPGPAPSRGRFPADGLPSVDDIVSATEAGAIAGEDAEVRAVLGNREVMTVLGEAQVQAMMRECAADGARLRFYLGIPEMRRKLMLLKQHGLIRFE